MSKRRATGNPFAISGVNNRLTVSQPSIESAGGRLRDAREAQEITEKEAARKLQLMVTDLRAIEADRYRAAANDDLLRRHLRDYANLVQLNPDSIVAIYDRQMGTCLQRGVDQSTDIPATKLQSFGGWLTGALMLMTLLLGLLVLLQFTTPSRVSALLAEYRDSLLVGLQTATNDNATNSKIEVAGQSPVTVGSGIVAGEDVARDNNAVLAVATVQPDPANAVPVLTSTVAPIAYITDAGELTEIAATYQSPGDADVDLNTNTVQAADELSFRFAKDCWVEVYDADQQRLIAEVRAAGGSLQLSGKSPFKVLVGRSREVVLQFNDNPIDIEKIERSHSTLFTVGRTGNNPEMPVVKTIRRKLPY